MSFVFHFALPPAFPSTVTFCHFHYPSSRHRERDRHAQDDTTDQRSAAAFDSHPQKSSREGSRELHRFGGQNRRSRVRVRLGKGVDEDLLRTAGVTQGAQKGEN